MIWLIKYSLRHFMWRIKLYTPHKVADKALFATLCHNLHILPQMLGIDSAYNDAGYAGLSQYKSQ